MHCAVFRLVFITGLGMEIGPRQPECQRDANFQSTSNPAVPADHIHIGNFEVELRGHPNL